MSLRAAMAQIVVVESALSISSPVALSSPRVYSIAPGRRNKLPEKVSFMNFPDAGTEARMGSQREDNFTVQIDCLVRDADLDRAADIALAFFDAAWTAFDAQRPAGARLGGTVDFLELRAERPMIESIEWAGEFLPGFHLFLDLTIFKAV